jgi:predicted RNA-binding Zn-ribbon protein involved in translation (DUF1610 family)
MNKSEMFNRLVENAFDFLFQAISEIEKQPKYSVIHFYASVELFVKARLMKEHWSLVISPKQEADWDKFIAGDFQSVTLNEAANKLKKVLRSGLSEAELDAFKKVANDRNKMIHFFHEAHSEGESGKFIRSIVKKQLKAWFFLHQLLIVKWKNEFSSWADEIAELDTELKKLHDFLQVVFDNLKPQIEEKKKKGIRFDECPSCGFESQELDEVKNTVYEAKCLVCSLVEKSLNIECPECGETVILKKEGFGQCQLCSKHLEPEDVAGALIDSGAAHIAAKEGDDSWDEGNCGDCDGYHTVVRTENDEWICASCFGVFESPEVCGWCNELNTGDMEDSYVTGCNHCEGMAGWHQDD